MNELVKRVKIFSYAHLDPDKFEPLTVGRYIARHYERGIPSFTHPLDLELKIVNWFDDGSRGEVPTNVSAENIMNELFNRYRDWKFNIFDTSDEQTNDNIITDMIQSIYANISEFYGRKISALLTDFNPAWNYDKFGKITTSYGSEKETTAHGEIENEYGKVTTTTTEKGTSTDNNVDETVNSQPTFELSEDVNDGKSQTTVNNYNETTGDTTSETLDRTDTVKAHDDVVSKDAHTDIVIDRTYGNIGVMTTTQAISEVLDVYNFDIIGEIVETIKKELLCYVG